MKIRNILFILTLFFIIFLCGCNDPLKRYEYDDLSYSYTYDSMGEQCVTIMELSEQGKQQERVVIPTYIGKLLVKGFGKEFAYRIEGVIESDNLKQIYIHNQIEMINNNFFAEIEDVTVFCGFDGENPLSISYYFIRCKEIYISKSDHEWLKSIDPTIDFYDKIRFANVIYYYNFDKDKTFFVDDCDGTTVNVIPPTPYRKGYEFAGWYKEPECINKWDFENDIVPAKEYDENGEYILKETKLYAKWEKND